MNINYERLFNYSIKMSNRWVATSNTVVAIAFINTLWNLGFLLTGHSEYISEHDCLYRLYLISFGLLGLSLIFGVVAVIAAKKLRSE